MTALHLTLFHEVESISNLEAKLRWYTVLIVTLSAMNYPDEIPNVWKHLETHYLPLLSQDGKLQAARKIREALTKSVGIVGAAKVLCTSICFGIVVLIHCNRLEPA
jgi:hypothetical protein